jgi:transposase, IS30 family
MPYRQITQVERYRIHDLLGLGWSPAQIAEELGRARSTITRELARNRTERGRYEPYPADCYARTRRRLARRHHRVAPWLWRAICRRLHDWWSPEQIAGRFRRTGEGWISYQTIYRRITEDERTGGTLHQCLRQSAWARQRRRSPRTRRPLGRPLAERPAYVYARREIGHWEIDTLLGAGSGAPCLVSAVERATGYVALGKLERPTATAFAERTIQLFQQQSRPVRTVTADNGTELTAWPVIEERTGSRFYFARAYCAWERGTNENTNGLLRQFLPKRASMAHLTQQDCNRIARQLNQRPRKRLGFRTPEECYEG